MGGVVVDRERFLIARHHDDALMRLAHDRGLFPQIIEIGIRIVDEPVAAEEVVRFKLDGRIVH